VKNKPIMTWAEFVRDVKSGVPVVDRYIKVPKDAEPLTTEPGDIIENNCFDLSEANNDCVIGNSPTALFKTKEEV